jgi:23S rRNA (uracil1939-C5)-methyltransferase
LDDALRVSLAAAALKYRLARLSWNDEIVATLSPPEQRIGPGQNHTTPGQFFAGHPTWGNLA